MELLIANRFGGVERVRVIGTVEETKPLPQPTEAPGPGIAVLVRLQYADVVSGSEFAFFQPGFSGTAVASLFPDTAGLLSLRAHTIGGTLVDVTGPLRNGVQLTAGQWSPPIPIPIAAGVVYSLTYSVAARIAVQVTGKEELLAEADTVQLAGSIAEVVATLQNDGSGHYYTSQAINLTNMEILQIIMPATWTAAVMTFQTSDSQTGTFQPLYDDMGNEVQLTVTQGQNVAVMNKSIACAALGWVKINSGSNAALVDQTAARTISFLGKM